MSTRAMALIRDYSGWLRLVLTLWLSALPLLFVLDVWLGWSQGVLLSPGGGSGQVAVDELPGWAVLLLAAIRQSDLLVQAGILVCIRGMVTDCRDGHIFSQANARRLRAIGVWLVVLAAVMPATPLLFAAAAAVLTGAAPALEIRIDLIPLFGAAVSLLFARMMALAAKLQEDSDLTI